GTRGNCVAFRLYCGMFLCGWWRTVCMLAFVVEAPQTKGYLAGRQQVEDAINAKEVGGGPDKEDYRNGAGIVEHQLQRQHAPLDPIGRQFLDHGLRRNIDKVQRDSGG